MPLDRMRSLELHRKARGKIKIYPTVNIHSEEDLALAYVPGSVAPALAIQENVEKCFEYTGKGNRVAVISDGTAILGLGDVGPEAGMPVIEGKCLLFKLFGDVNAIPLCVNSPRNAEDIVHLAMMLAPNFGGINIEDISSPNTFTVVRELQNRLDIPVFCDDQQGTAVVVLAGLWNALEIVDKRLSEISIVICGSGAAGIATAELLFTAGAKTSPC
jgi:malate dehydrogenase (oxaloacetate-decarboxylating)